MLAGLAAAVADRLGVELPPLRLLTQWGEPMPVELPDDVVAAPGLLGSAAEQLLDHGERKRSGAWFTPPEVAATLAGWALDGLGSADAPPLVLDPAAGGGAFLLAAAEVLGRRGVDPVVVVSRHVVGVERDPVSAAVAEAALALWCGGGAVPSIA
ncbi:MAG: SAM-dependent methyltransferase, partial [Actinomycetota bacterium]|nr:SAM-dependent methyltransferase [Actinomycetota bacterium]